MTMAMSHQQQEAEYAAILNAAPAPASKPLLLIRHGNDINNSISNAAPLKSSYFYPQITDAWLHQCAKEMNETEHIMVPFAGSLVMHNYRLGDCIKWCDACFTHMFGPTTMLHQYKAVACPARKRNYKLGGNLAIVNRLFRKRDGQPGFEKPANDTLAIHLRLGDVIERSNSSTATMLTTGASPKHIQVFANSIKSIYELLANFKESGMSKVVIVGGSHKAQMFRKSRVYVGCIEKAFLTAGIEVEMRLNTTDPDMDFYYASHARKIVVSTGGFSRLLGRLVALGGGEVIGRQFLEQQKPPESKK
jgi:hypothetical protein